MERARRGARWPTVCLSMYSITENINYSQLCSVAILLQLEPNWFMSYNTRNGLGSLYVLSSCGLPVPPTSLLVTVNEDCSYFASTTALSPDDGGSKRLVNVNQFLRDYAPQILEYSYSYRIINH
jgi:hypothetical protein